MMMVMVKAVIVMVVMIVLVVVVMGKVVIVMVVMIVLVVVVRLLKSHGGDLDLEERAVIKVILASFMGSSGNNRETIQQLFGSNF